MESINKAKLKSLTDSKVTEKSDYVKRAKSWFGHFGKFSRNFLSMLFVIRVNLLHPYPSLFPYGVLLSLWCFSILVNNYFQVYCNLKIISHVADITLNAVTKVL